MIVLNHFQGRASRSFLAFVAFALSFLYSCCRMPYEQGSLQPEWETVIPTGTSGEIFYEGLPNMPKSGDIIVAHTTLRDEGFLAEDNRLCAIDVNTGNVAWYFPANQNEKHNCFFNAKGYRTRNLESAYSANYDGEPLKGEPFMALYGWDTGMYLLKSLGVEGRIDEDTPLYEGVQTSFRWERGDNWRGFTNQAVIIVHFSTDHQITVNVK